MGKNQKKVQEAPYFGHLHTHFWGVYFSHESRGGLILAYSGGCLFWILLKICRGLIFRGGG